VAQSSQFRHPIRPWTEGKTIQSSDRTPNLTETRRRIPLDSQRFPAGFRLWFQMHRLQTWEGTVIAGRDLQITNPAKLIQRRGTTDSSSESSYYIQRSARAKIEHSTPSSMAVSAQPTLQLKDIIHRSVENTPLPTPIAEATSHAAAVLEGAGRQDRVEPADENATLEGRLAAGACSRAVSWIDP